jgi:hypothetical protein
MTPLYQRIVEFDQGDAERNELVRRVWSVTPFVVNVRTGSICQSRADSRYRDMMLWCHDAFGKQAFPFGDDPLHGDWQFGGATVDGWTYVGFKTREQMEWFKAAFPDRCEEQE